MCIYVMYQPNVLNQQQMDNLNDELQLVIPHPAYSRNYS